MNVEMKKFAEELKLKIREYLPDEYQECTFREVEIVKLNDQLLHGIILEKEDLYASPTIYVEDMYEIHVRENFSVDEIAKQVAGVFIQVIKEPKVPEFDLNFEEAKDDLCLRLINKERNKNLLEKVPYMDAESTGLALIADIVKEEEADSYRAIVSADILESMGIFQEELFEIAIENAARKDRAFLMDMNSAFARKSVNLLDRSDPLTPSEIEGMYVLTNESRMYGAAALFYPGVRKRIAELLGSGYYALPSSVHEFVIVPDEESVQKEGLLNIVKGANKDVVSDEEVLSDNVFYCDEDGVIKVIAAA